jgi:hypothetical protein
MVSALTEEFVGNIAQLIFDETFLLCLLLDLFNEVLELRHNVLLKLIRRDQ